MDLRTLVATDPARFLRRDQAGLVKRSRKSRTRRRRAIFAAVLAAAALTVGTVYAGRHYLTHSPRFSLRGIVLAPTQHAQAAELRRVLERRRGRNLFRLDLERMEQELEHCRWVKTASIKRLLPDRIYCAIEEREPRGLALVKGRVWLVDEEGVAIDLYGEATRDLSFPIFKGIDDTDTDHGRGQVTRGLALLAFLRATHPDLVGEISEIDLSRDDRISMHMNQGGPVVRLHPSDFGTNLDHYFGLRDYLATHFDEGGYVDLRFRDRIAFQPVISRGQ